MSVYFLKPFVAFVWAQALFCFYKHEIARLSVAVYVNITNQVKFIFCMTLLEF